MSAPVCDLIVLVWNRLDETRQCVASLLHHTDVSSRLLLVDNGSAEDTAEWLRTVRPAGHIAEVQVLHSNVNEGYARGMNRGLRAASAPYACLLNNDIVVTTGWLSEMLAVANSDARIGLVNPSSNTLGQHAAPDESPDHLAAALRAHAGRWVEMGSAVGFCMLLTPAARKAVPLLDESYGMAFFEDTEYSRRAQAAGLVCARACGCYVHHWEHRSVETLWPTRQEQAGAFEQNAAKFYAKWGRPERLAYVFVPNGHAVNVAEELRAQANKDSSVTVFFPRTAPVAVPVHMKVVTQPLSARAFGAQALWQLLKKKKKYDRIISNHAGLAWTLRQLRWLHRAQIALQ